MQDALDVVGARALREWITGIPEVYARVFFLEDAAVADSVAEVAHDDDVILVPADGGALRSSATVVPYSGAFREIGDELFLGERSVELQDYVAAAFVQIVGPTAVCLSDDACRTAFLDDADLARRTGVFPSALIDPSVILADRGAMETAHDLALPTALRIDAGGRVSVGVRGASIGGLDDLPRLPAIPRASVAVSAATGRSAASTEAGDREAMRRYLAATDLLKMLRVGNGVVRIAGFGWSPLDDDRADADPRTADPFLIETTEGVVLADIATRRRRLLSSATATVVASVQTSSAREVAAERIARQLGVTAAAADRLCGDAVSSLEIAFGVRVPDEQRTGVPG